MKHSWGGFATAVAPQPAHRVAVSIKGNTSGFRSTASAKDATVVGFNRQLDCDFFQGPAEETLALNEASALSRPLLRIFSRFPSVHLLLQTAQDALRGRFATLELRVDSRCWEVYVTPRLDARAGGIDGLLLFLRSSEGRVELTDVLAESSQRYRFAAESARVGVWEWHLTDGDIRFDPVLLAMLALEEDRKIGRDEVCKTMLSAEDGEYLRRTLSDLVQGRQERAELDLRARGANGETRILHLNAILMRGNNGEPEKIVGSAVDATSLREAEFRARQSEAKLRELFENATDMMYSTDIEGNIRTANKALQHTCGYPREELLHMNLRDLVFPEDRDVIESMLLSRLGGGGKPIDELCIRHRDGRRIYVEASHRLVFEDGRPGAIQGIARNVTERKMLEAQLRQAQKMEAVGTLAGGIAHDFNNLLTGILGFADLLKAHPDHPDKTLEAAEIIQKAAERATKLTSQLIGFARQGKTQNARISINELISELSEFLSHTLPRSIRIHQDLTEESLYVLGDHNQLHQALLNLALNARDAMTGGGQMVFRSERVSQAEVGEAGVAANPDEEWVCISVSDTGEGIAPEHLTRIFEPFFTTKPVGKGSGMGLAMVYSITRNHNGHIDVESKQKSGTTFRIFLPLVRRDAVLVTADEGLSPREGSGQILLVDDEEIVLTVAKMMLSQLGYKVLAVNNAAEAIEIYRAKRAQIDLVFLDVMMPEMDGTECARRLRAEFPDARILLTSGYMLDLGDGKGPSADGLPILNKPYQLSDLSIAIEQVIGARATAS